MKKTVFYGLVLAGVITNAMAEGSTLDVSGVTLDTIPTFVFVGLFLITVSVLWCVDRAFDI